MMKSFLACSILATLSSRIYASPLVQQNVEKRTAIGPGCSWCTPGPWVTSAACNSYEYFAVASSMKNPPDNIKFDATSFCSEFLRPLITQLSIISVTAATTTSTSTYISLVYYTPPATKTSISPKTTTAPLNPASPIITASPQLPAAQAIEKRSFTVPEYLEPWYYYGRLDPGCSCIITSADPSILLSATETTTFYNYTMSTTVTEVYTIYPGP